MTYSRALPEAMGYTVTMDDPAGYDVTRMLVYRGDGTKVWNPRDDSAQCFEVLCWLMMHGGSGDRQYAVNRYSIICSYYDEDGEEVLAWNIWHTNTPASLRAAIVEAAERVADAKGEK